MTRLLVRVACALGWHSYVNHHEREGVTVEQVVLASVKHAEWTSTGGATGCTLCRDRSFAERVAAGGHHIKCAQEMARDEGARGIRAAMVCGDLRARLIDVVVDPRLGQWREHLDRWSEL